MREDFLWGGSIAAHQCEGAWREGRSFLEMLLLMQDAALCSEAWDEEPEGTAAVLA